MRKIDCSLINNRIITQALSIVQDQDICHKNYVASQARSESCSTIIKFGNLVSAIILSKLTLRFDI